MPRGDKTKETYDKVADFYENKGDKEWAKAKNGDGGHHYNNAREAYEKSKEVREAGNKRFGK